MLVVFYGTSGEVTPLRILTLLYPLFPRMRHRSRALRSDLKDDPTVVGAERRRGSDALAAEPAQSHARGLSCENMLEVAAKSAAKLSQKMERRINTHLILGIFVGLVGLLVWYFSFSFALLDKEHWISQLLPRVTILLFIELLAGFFLRQYRIGVEDLKYFLELERQAVCRRVAYSIIFSSGFDDATAKQKFLDALIDTRSTLVLHQGDTNTVLEAMKLEENIALKGFGVLGEQLDRLTKLVRDQK